MHDIDSTPASRYEPGLTARQLIMRVEGLLADQRAAEHLICRYLADLSDRIQERWRAPHCREPQGSVFTDVYEAARTRFGMSVRRARERVRIGYALRYLPQIEMALIEGKLGYSRVREVTRVATAGTESEWLHLAETLPMSTLEKHVAAACRPRRSGGAPREKTSGRRHLQWTSSTNVELRISLRADQFAVVYRALEAAKRAAKGSIDDAEALACIANAALAGGALPNDAPLDGALKGDAGDNELEASAADVLGASAADVLGASAVNVLGASPANAMTQAGSLVGPLDHLMGPECIQLLETMATRGGWHVDSLVEASGLRAEEVSRAVMLLEIQGKVRHEHGTYQVM